MADGCGQRRHGGGDSLAAAEGAPRSYPAACLHISATMRPLARCLQAAARLVPMSTGPAARVRPTAALTIARSLGSSASRLGSRGSKWRPRHHERRPTPAVVRAMRERAEAADPQVQQRRQPLEPGHSHYYATCHPGLEEVVAAELRGARIGAANVHPGAPLAPPLGAAPACMHACMPCLLYARLDSAVLDMLMQGACTPRMRRTAIALPPRRCPPTRTRARPSPQARRACPSPARQLLATAPTSGCAPPSGCCSCSTSACWMRGGRRARRFTTPSAAPPTGRACCSRGRASRWRGACGAAPTSPPRRWEAWLGCAGRLVVEAGAAGTLGLVRCGSDCKCVPAGARPFTQRPPAADAKPLPCSCCACGRGTRSAMPCAMRAAPSRSRPSGAPWPTCRCL